MYTCLKENLDNDSDCVNVHLFPMPFSFSVAGFNIKIYLQYNINSKYIGVISKIMAKEMNFLVYVLKSQICSQPQISRNHSMKVLNVR